MYGTNNIAVATFSYGLIPGAEAAEAYGPVIASFDSTPVELDVAFPARSAFDENDQFGYYQTVHRSIRAAFAAAGYPALTALVGGNTVAGTHIVTHIYDGTGFATADPFAA